MGQFYSREFDGDPYIDLMRAIPEREITWWVQKVIWLAEGFTFFDHFTRTYPTIFQHKCERCKGAGTLICPGCAGLKVKRGALAGLNLKEHKSLSRLPGASQDEECRTCAPGCSWDHESEWEGRWQEWESKLAYYDRAYGPLMDEWYEDVINAGNLEEDTQVPEDEAPGPEVQGRWADEERQLKRDRKRMEALMKRFGHPYDADRVLGYAIVDPTASLGENVWNLQEAYNFLPPELNPLAHPRAADPSSATRAKLGQFLTEVSMEAALMQNLDAAVRDTPKPHRLGASAGTVECPECKGEAWFYSVFPNPQAIFRTDTPFWHSTLQQLNRYWYPATSSADAATGRVLPYGEHGLRSMLAAQQQVSPADAITGRAPHSTQRYRAELQALLERPELRSSALRLQSSASRLPREIWEHNEEQEQQQRQADKKGLAGAVVPLRG